MGADAQGHEDLGPNHALMVAREGDVRNPMRENPDTSLKILRLLADEEHYPSRLDRQDISNHLNISDAETLLHIKCCVDNDLMDAKIQNHPTANDPTRLLISPILGLTSKGQEFVRQADAADGKWWKKAKERCAEAGVETSISTLSQAMTSLIRTAIESGGS